MPEPREASEERQEQTFAPGEDRGAVFHTHHMGRSMKAYPVYENELNTFGLLNTLALAFFSLGSGFASFGVGLLVDAAFAKDLSDLSEVLIKVMVPVCGILAILFFLGGIWALLTRRSEVKRVKSESYER